MKTLLFVLFVFGALQCYAQVTVTLDAVTLSNLAILKPNFTLTQGSTLVSYSGNLTGMAAVTLPTDGLWNLTITKNAYLTFRSNYNFTDAPATVVIPMATSVSNTLRYKYVLNYLASGANYDLQLFTPFGCVANKSSSCSGKFNVVSTSAITYIDLIANSSYNGFYRLMASYSTFDSRALIQLVTPTEVSDYYYQNSASVVSAGAWYVADYLICSWGSEITTVNKVDSTSFTYPWAYDYCSYQPITVIGNVQSNVSDIDNVTITFIDTTGAYPNVTVFTGLANSNYTVNLRTTTYRILVSRSGYYSYDNTTTFTTATTSFDIVLLSIPTTTSTTSTTSSSTSSSTSGTTSSSTSSSTSGSSTSSSTSSSSSTGAAGTTGASSTTAAGTTTTGTTTEDSTSISTTGSSTTGQQSSASVAVVSLFSVVVAIVLVL